MVDRAQSVSADHARLLSVIQALPQGIVIVDSSGRVETVNRRAEELTGRTASELADFVSNPPWRLFREDGTELTEAEGPLVHALTSGRATRNARLRVVRDDGREFLFEYSASPVEDEGGVVAVVITFHDVTGQAARERAQREFITNAAHELQTPLAAISSAIDVLQAGAKDEPANRDHFLTHIEHACARLERLTRALLVLARAQALAESPRREVVAIGPLLASIADALPRAAGATIAVDCEPDVAAVANRPLLEQAIVNLGHNALKHTRSEVVLGAARTDGVVRITVSDNGRGIAEEERGRIFDRFYRTEGDTVVGFGLGLAIVSEAVKALDGELGLETSPAGTTFAITLPSVRILEP
jgi:PAS domain S-box-containing protein